MAPRKDVCASSNRTGVPPSLEPALRRVYPNGVNRMLQRAWIPSISSRCPSSSPSPTAGRVVSCAVMGKGRHHHLSTWNSSFPPLHLHSPPRARPIPPCFLVPILILVPSIRFLVGLQSSSQGRRWEEAGDPVSSTWIAMEGKRDASAVFRKGADGSERFVASKEVRSTRPRRRTCVRSGFGGRLTRLRTGWEGAAGRRFDVARGHLRRRRASVGGMAPSSSRGGGGGAPATPPGHASRRRASFGRGRGGVPVDVGGRASSCASLGPSAGAAGAEILPHGARPSTSFPSTCFHARVRTCGGPDARAKASTRGRPGGAGASQIHGRIARAIPRPVSLQPRRRRRRRAHRRRASSPSTFRREPSGMMEAHGTPSLPRPIPSRMANGEWGMGNGGWDPPCPSPEHPSTKGTRIGTEVRPRRWGFSIPNGILLDFHGGMDAMMEGPRRCKTWTST